MGSNPGCNRGAGVLELLSPPRSKWVPVRAELVVVVFD